MSAARPGLYICDERCVVAQGDLAHLVLVRQPTSWIRSTGPGATRQALTKRCGSSVLHSDREMTCYRVYSRRPHAVLLATLEVEYTLTADQCTDVSNSTAGADEGGAEGLVQCNGWDWDGSA